MKIISFGISDLGQKRNLNEDSYFVSDELGLYLVADGMGGHRAGDVASSTAVEIIAGHIGSWLEGEKDGASISSDVTVVDEDNVLINAVRKANDRLCEMSQQNNALSGMGTTIVGLLHTQGKAHVVNVGDSRAYRIRNDLILQLTTDHSWVGEQLQRNLISEDEARLHRWRNIITRALGNREDVEIDVSKHDIEPGDCFVLCTDGLSGMLTDEEILDIVKDAGDDMEEACRNLVAQSNEKGGLDNITVVLVKFGD
jgi:protein phosphatase